MTPLPRTPLLNQRSRDDVRRFSTRLLSLADRGRVTFELLRDLARMLGEYAGCATVEIACLEKGRLLKADFRLGETPEFFCSAARPADSPQAGLRVFLERHGVYADAAWPMREDGTAGGLVLPSLTAGDGASGPGRVLAFIPAGETLRGALALGCAAPLVLDETGRRRLEDVALMVGLALSHNQTQFELRERVKELTCMYAIASLAARPGQSLDELLRGVASLLPPAYLYPGVAEARVQFDGASYETPGFVETPWRQAADIVVRGERRGAVETAYGQSRPELDEGPFLADERRLIDSVARELGIIVERREAEQEQARLEEQLRRADRLATLGQLAAGVAHELNEPLTGILGFAELLKEASAADPQAREDLARIEAAALHAREVVRKLLLFAKQIPPRRQPVDLNRVAREVLWFFEGRCAKRGIRVETRLATDLPTITADEAQMRQVVLNLAVNAIHAMPTGGVLTVGTEAEADGARLIVRDNGEGMDDEVREKIFLPFFTTKDVDQGTGLGLSVVHGIVKAHGGRIEVQSRPGEGSTFTAILPTRGSEHG